MLFIGLDKSEYWVNILFLQENICCGYSLEVPHLRLVGGGGGGVSLD